MLHFGLYDTNDQLIFDLANRVSGLTFSSGEHGFHDLSCFVNMELQEAFRLYDRPGLPRVYVTSHGYTVWAGRLEDVSIVNGGVRLRAFGYWRALSDAPYTALWSTDKVGDWRISDERNATSRSPSMYRHDNNGRLYISLNKGAVYGNGLNTASWHYIVPHSSSQLINYWSCSYDLTLPTNWQAQWIQATTPSDDIYGVFGTATVLATVTGDGTNKTGTQTLTLSPVENTVYFRIRNNTGGNYTVTAEDDGWYAKLTNVRVTALDGTVYADEMVKALITFCNTLNSTQLASSTGLVQSPALDLRDEVYEDQFPADIITRLAALGDNQTPPRQWEAVVWADRVLRYQPKGTDAQVYYVDITSLELERSLNLLRNSAYGVYQEASGRKLRTSTAVNQQSIDRYGLTRRNKVTVATTSSTQAGTHRDAYLEDNRDPKPQAAIEFDQLYDAAGNRVPNYLGRAGDTIVIRNLPPTLSVDIDRIRQFRSSFARYDAKTGRISFTPEAALPSLDRLVARRAEGIR